MGLKYNPFTGSFDFTGVAPSTLSNYVPKAGGTMTGTLNSLSVLPVTNLGYNLGSTSFRYSNVWTQRLNVNASSYIDGAVGGLFGFNTTATHTLTLPSTATGIALYLTSDQTTNLERLRIYQASSTINIQSDSAGSGTARNIAIGGATSKITIQPNGVFLPVQAVTASAPTYVKGGVYFDTTLNKLRVGGATAWETVTST